MVGVLRPQVPVGRLSWWRQMGCVLGQLTIDGVRQVCVEGLGPLFFQGCCMKQTP